MAGHSKWANIKFRKAAQDNRRGKLFSKLIREITVATRAGGAEPDGNPRLRTAIDKALAANMSRDVINRAVGRGSGEGGGDDYQEVWYEGYGPGGVAVLVECATDNRNRTVSEIRHAFSKHGGNLGTEGSVAYLFQRVGMLRFSSKNDEDELMDIVVSAGAEDLEVLDDGSINVTTPTETFQQVLAAVEQAGFDCESAQIEQRAVSDLELNDASSESVLKLLDALDNIDDVQDVYTNASFPEVVA